MADANDNNKVTSLTGLGGKIVTSLPGQFLALVLVNVIFILGILWFLEKQQEIASRVALDVFQRCISGALTIPGPSGPQK